MWLETYTHMDSESWEQKKKEVPNCLKKGHGSFKTEDNLS